MIGSSAIRSSSPSIALVPFLEARRRVVSLHVGRDAEMIPDVHTNPFPLISNRGSFVSFSIVIPNCARNVCGPRLL